ncbi:MAG: hypothetical protein VKK62_07635 [Synechococcaceae cyanobacterium]|nr:hypothetical protein [Synechococcaceae cyanobacterium]
MQRHTALLSSPRRRMVALAGLALACITAAGFGLWRLNRQSEPLAVSITSWPGNEYLFLAEQKRLADQFGIELDVKQYSSLLDQRRSYIDGDVRVMATNLPETLSICQDVPSRCPVLVLVLDESRGADRLIALASITAPAQLTGRNVGIERSVLPEYLLQRSLAGSAVGTDQLKLRFDGPVGLVQRLDDGELDAIVTYSPHDTLLRQDPRFQELFSSARIPGEIVDVLAVDPALARHAPQQLRALVRTWWAARAYAGRHPREAVAMMAGRQKITPDQFRLTEQGVRYPDAAEQHRLLAQDSPLASTLQRMARLMQASGRLRPDAPLPRLSAEYLEEP